MAYEYILSERQGGVALITLNRPEKLNALSFLLMQEVDDALTGYEADDKCAWSPALFTDQGFAYQYEWSNASRACVKTR